MTITTTDTKAQLLSEAERLVRTRGYAAFSYADLSERVGIRKASIHHHFPTKENLGTAVIDAYLERFVAALDELANEPLGTKAKLVAYGNFFCDSLRDGLMPLCGALASDVAYLPPSMQQRVEEFFQIHLDWLERILAEGMTKKELATKATAKHTALLLLSTLQGASVVARALNDPTIINLTFRQALESL
jgi:TetR/AcrR family transcriptional repressor of nem operon